MIETTAIPKELQALHACNRLAFGPRPGDLAMINRIGAARWIEQQLHPETIPERPELTREIESLATLRMTPIDLFMRYGPPLPAAAKPDPDVRKAARQESRIVLEQAMRARLYRAITSPRQLQEVMTAFWFNHFNVFAGKGLCHLWVGAYEEQAIRPHALGRFRDLLGATARHPAMLFYLDNWQNTAPASPGARGKLEGINENYARELMELHTLGVNGGYAQADVIALAHILTGWGIVRRENPSGGGFWRRRALEDAGAVRTREGFFFDPSRHDFADKTLLGEHIRGGGIGEGEHALDLLARHPATARHLSYQLAQYFVADDPPPGLVERMSARYLAGDGNIRDALASLFADPEFWDRRHYGAKFKTPYEFVISAVRATGLPVRNVRPLFGTMAGLGMPPYGCQTPDGFKNTQAAWLNPEAMMIRLSFATGLGAGRLPLDRQPENASGDPTDNAGRFAAGRGMRRIAFGDGGAEPTPPDPRVLATTLGGLFAARTAAAVEATPDRLRAPLILGSPDFMMR
jgi:uncharacterized protein (DUF1800 family)